MSMTRISRPSSASAGFDDIGKGGVGDQRLGLAVVQDEADGGRVQAHVERVQDRARHGHAVVRLERGRGIGRHDRDRVARTDAARDQRRGQAPAAGVSLGPALPQLAVDHRRVVRVDLGRAGQEAERAKRRVVGPVLAEIAAPGFVAVLVSAVGHAALPVGSVAAPRLSSWPFDTQM